MPTGPSQSALVAEALNRLVCPACRQSLALDGDSIRCSGCSRLYPILEGIPILLVERAF
jgi:uncharacterized protein YbaR (Trm112 family)